MNNPIPDYTKASIDNYVKNGVPTGSFLYAFLCKDLEALALCDDNNRDALINIWRYCYNKIPGDCWGSREKVHDWIAKGGASKTPPCNEKELK